MVLAEIFIIAGIRIEFILFGLILLGIAIFHNHTLLVAIVGLINILFIKITFMNFDIIHHLGEEWQVLLNLFGLLMGFALLSKHFEESGIPGILPKYLPDDWKGPFVLLVLTFIMSSFLDNIAAAMIGGTIANIVFRGKVHLGYLAGIVACSNAGGAGSVIGDTTTTMMWIDGIEVSNVIKAYVGAIPVLFVVGIIASFQQDKYNRITKDATLTEEHVQWNRIIVVALILLSAILTNIYLDFPALGVWVVLLVASIFLKTHWAECKHALPGSIFLISLVLSASMMPVEHLPSATWQSTMIIGFISSVFDNIPLTKIALEQGGYDWALLAYAVGYGGSMIWFGSSAGVALSNMYPETRSVAKWISSGWHTILGYIIGFIIMFLLLGWNP